MRKSGHETQEVILHANDPPHTELIFDSFDEQQQKTGSSPPPVGSCLKSLNILQFFDFFFLFAFNVTYLTLGIQPFPSLNWFLLTTC